MHRPLNDDFDENAMMGKVSRNPLAAYFRLPGLHVTLPTRGAYLPPGGCSLTMAKDLPVLPMRAADELLLKNPDALMSGYALEKLLESCVPSITTPLEISAPDLDVLLLAIRAASYGEMMETTITCPSCNTDSTFDVHLPSMLSDMTMIDPETTVRLNDDVIVYLRPYTVRHATRLAFATFQEARGLQGLPAEATPEERSHSINESMARIAALENELVADCVLSVVTPSDVVDDPIYIKEFIDNIAKPWSKKIEDCLMTINGRGINKRVAVSCSHCSHAWETDIEFNPVNFFSPGSSA